MDILSAWGGGNKITVSEPFSGMKLYLRASYPNYQSIEILKSATTFRPYINKIDPYAIQVTMGMYNNSFGLCYGNSGQPVDTDVYWKTRVEWRNSSSPSTYTYRSTILGTKQNISDSSWNHPASGAVTPITMTSVWLETRIAANSMSFGSSSASIAGVYLDMTAHIRIKNRKDSTILTKIVETSIAAKKLQENDAAIQYALATDKAITI